MSKKGAVPDAWEDDWVNVADKPEVKLAQPDPAPASKAERKAQHRELQKQIWDSADNPGRNHWLETKGVVPLKQEFKPQVTLLSRKPAPVTAKKDATTDGSGKPSLDDEEDSEEEARRKREVDLEERQRKAKLERDEKQKRYNEARERIMGSPKPGSPTAGSRESSQGRDSRRARARVNGNANTQPTSSADHSPTRGSTGEKQLLDPHDVIRRVPKKDGSTSPSRQPRGPDKNGRGGFGFAGRGGLPSV